MQFFKSNTVNGPSEEGKLSRGMFSVVTQLANNLPPEHLAQEFCNIFTTESDKISLAWIWFGNPNENIIQPQFYSGAASSYAQTSVISRNFVTNSGPFFKALDGEATVSFNISSLSLYGPWRKLNRDFGIRSAIAIRLFSKLDSQIGIMVLYSTEDDYFEKIGIEFFEKLGPFVGAILAKNSLTIELERAANTDSLTGLANRAHSISIFADLSDRALRAKDQRQVGEASNSVIMFDIDRFKAINDTYGHFTGDRVITEVARRARAAVRDSDTVIRWGGEEFLVVAYKTNLDQAVAIAEKIRLSIAETVFSINGEKIPVTVSAGVANIREHEIVSEAVARADVKLYLSKNNGRNQVSS